MLFSVKFFTWITKPPRKVANRHICLFLLNNLKCNKHITYSFQVQDCKWGEWEAWDDCPKSCGNGGLQLQERFREKVQETISTGPSMSIPNNFNHQIHLSELSVLFKVIHFYRSNLPVLFMVKILILTLKLVS